MAGHDQRKGFFFLRRSGVEPPEELSRQIFSFIEHDFPLVMGKSSTAVAFLLLLKLLRSVVLQDVAAMKLLNLDHMIFHLPVFESELFARFMESLNSTLL